MKRVQWEGEALATSSGAADETSARSSSTPSASIANAPLHADDGILSNANTAMADDPAVNSAHLQFSCGNSGPLLDLDVETFPLDESLTFDGLLAFEDYTTNQLQCLTDVSLASFDNLAPWCSWSLRRFSLSVVTETPFVEGDSNLLGIPQTDRPSTLITMPTLSFAH